MAKFIFRVDGKVVNGITQKLPGATGKFESSAKCPDCDSSFTSNKNAGQNRTIAQLESAVRTMVRRHYDKKHGR